MRSVAQSLLVLLGFCASLSAGFPSQSLANVIVSEDTVKWYEIRGNSTRELHNSMRRNSPAKQFDAYTRWFINWEYSWQKAGSGCRMVKATVTLRINIDFPKLASQAGMPPNVLRKWNNYSSALMAHERGHARNGSEAAEAIDTMLMGLSIPRGCDHMQAEANEAAMKIIRQANKRDKDYDRRTKHGATEGAMLH